MTAKGSYKDFEEARAFVRTLGLKRQKDWEAYCKSGQKPPDIPRHPDRTYKDRWINTGDWLGTGNVATRHRRYRPLGEVREFLLSQGIKSKSGWEAYCRSGKRPADIPSSLEVVYEGEWPGWGEFLGTGNVPGYQMKFRPFEEARAYVRGLGFKGQKDFRKWAHSDQRPKDIPTLPEKTYKKEWRGLHDFLGVGLPRGARPFGGWRPFEEARDFVRGLGLKNSPEWLDYCASGERRDDIPASPEAVYADEWRGFADWLGSGQARGRWRSFEEAREFVRGLGIRGKEEWEEYAKSGQKPLDIPANPAQVYGNKWR